MIGPMLQAILIPIFASAIALAVGRYLKEKTGWIALAASLYSTCLLGGVFLATYKGNKVFEIYGRLPAVGKVYFLGDGLSAPIALTIAVLCTVIAGYSMGYMKEQPHLGAYFALYLLYEAGMIGTVLSANMVLFFVFFELMLLPSWALIAVWGTGDRIRIAFKYFMFTEAGALSLLAGIAATGYFAGTYDMLKVASQLNVDAFTLHVIVVAILLGLFVKMAIFPLHTWLPDAHAEAPTPISALLSPAMIGIGGYAIIRFLYTCFPTVLETYYFALALLILATITMIYGGAMAYAQDDIKRLLAYSSISQMGYMLFGIASLSTVGILGALLIYVNHGLCKAVLFMVSGIFMHELGTRSIKELRGLAAKMPYTAVATLVAFLGLAGVPPLLGFWGEVYVFLGSVYTALSRGTPDVVWLSITGIAIVFSILTAGYGLWTVKRVFYGEESERVKKAHRASWTLVVPALFLMVLAVIFGVYPTPIMISFGAYP